MKKYFLIILLLTGFVAMAQDQSFSDKIEPVTISGYGQKSDISTIPKVIFVLTAKDIEQKHIESIAALLSNIAGMDLRTRGGKGVQADVSIRGGNFDQILVLLNGIPVNNPQTGHHNLDLPIDVSMIQKVELLEGASGQSFGVNAYSGVINIITKNPNKKQAEAGIELGQFGYLKTDWNIQHQLDNIAVFNGFTYQRSNGYLTKEKINNTDFYTIKDFLQVQIKTKNNPVNIQAGYHQKDFGANSFYTSKYPWQYEKTKSYFVNISRKFGQKFVVEPQLSYHLHFDEFQLFRESVYKYNNGFYIHKKDTAQFAPGVYYQGHNHHKTQVVLANIKSSFKSKFGDTNIDFSLRDERIWSNVLGITLVQPNSDENNLYGKKAKRFYGTLTLNQIHKLGDFHLGTGLSFLYNNDYKLNVTGGFYINHLTSNWTKYISINSAVRLPTFTDLYYQGPSNIGNPDLKPEKSINYEGGVKYHKADFRSNLAVFYRQGKNTIDWVKNNPSDKWQPQNLTLLNTFGVELSLQKNFKDKWLKKIEFSYAYLKMDKTKNIISKYALDYLKHKFAGSVQHRFLFNSNLTWQVLYKQRNGQYLDYVSGNYHLFDYKPYFLTNLKLSKTYKKYHFGLSVENLFNVEYRDLSYVKMPGRWIIFEVKYRLF